MNMMNGALCALVFACATASAPAATLTIDDFVRHPTYSSAKISPNGEYLAMTVDRGDEDVLVVLRTKDLSPLKVNQLPAFRGAKQSVGSFYWVSPERLLFTGVTKVGKYEQPAATGEWYAVNADGSQPRPLITYGTRAATERHKDAGFNGFGLVDTLRDDDTNVLMRESSWTGESSMTSIVLMDTRTGFRKPVARAPKGNCSLVLDAQKSPRFAICASSRNEQGEHDELTELHRRGDDGKWVLVNASKNGGRHLSVIGTSADGVVYASQSDGKAPAAFGTLDTATGTFTPLHQDPVADVSDLVWSPDGTRVLALATEAGAPKVTMIDDAHADAALYESLAASFPGEMVDFSSATTDGSKVIVSVYSDVNPGELYLYDRATKQARFLMQNAKWLPKAAMSPVKPFSFRARDGKTIYGYLTLPKDSARRGLPLIVNPHGGPIGPRDSWRFNNEVQMLAHQGYAVLQVNFRGSGGYGRAFQNAGHRQWAEGIQNDIIDATRWAIDQGYVDKDRICIYGGSFGGYSSLMAPAREPGLYKCAFGYVGVYDMPMMFEKGDIPQSNDGQNFLRRTLGTDKATLLATSPTHLADRIRIPVYLAAGARDARAVPEQTEAMAEALRRAGNPPEGVIIQPGEMHGFYKEENNKRLYTEMLKFFERHIGARN